MIMNGNTSRSLSAAGRLAVAACCLLLPLVPIQAQQPPNEDRNDSRDQQIQQLRKAIQALEEQQRAEQTQRAAEWLGRIKEQEARAEKADQKAREELRALRLQEAQVAQSQEAEQRVRNLRLHVADEKPNPDIQKAERMIEEIAKAIEVKRRELRGLEEKLQFARAELEKTRADNARAEGERRIRVRDELNLRDAETHREPLIIKIDPNVSPEQIKAQVEAIQAKIKQPIRVEIINPDGKIQGRIESAPSRRNRPADTAPEPRSSQSSSGRKESAPAAETPEPRWRQSEIRKEPTLEQKLEKIMKEVEELRRELRSSRH
jgi:hypothetical protein